MRRVVSISHLISFGFQLMLMAAPWISISSLNNLSLRRMIKYPRTQNVYKWATISTSTMSSNRSARLTKSFEFGIVVCPLGVVCSSGYSILYILTWRFRESISSRWTFPSRVHFSEDIKKLLEINGGAGRKKKTWNWKKKVISWNRAPSAVINPHGISSDADQCGIRLRGRVMEWNRVLGDELKDSWVVGFKSMHSLYNTTHICIFGQKRYIGTYWYYIGVHRARMVVPVLCRIRATNTAALCWQRYELLPL